MLNAYEIMTKEAAKIAAAGAVVGNELEKLRKVVEELKDNEAQRHLDSNLELGAVLSQIDKLLATIEGKDDPVQEPEDTSSELKAAE